MEQLGAISLTDQLFFDTDCISAFLWVGKQSILSKLYPNKIRIPKQVYAELSYPGVSHLKERVDTLIRNGDAKIVDIEANSDDYDFYTELTCDPKDGKKSIGKGEAACIVFARKENGIIASNNLRDIDFYVKEYNLKHKTTGDIMVDAVSLGIITDEQANKLWDAMIRKRRKLGADTFSSYLKNH